MLIQHLENSRKADPVFSASLLALAVHRVMVGPDGVHHIDVFSSLSDVLW